MSILSLRLTILLDISTNCYAHLLNDTIYLYVDGEFSEIFYIDNVEELVDPLPLITYEMEFSSQTSLYKLLIFSFFE